MKDGKYIDIVCPTGLTIEYNAVQFGVMPFDGLKQDYCLESAIPENSCDSYIDKDFIKN
jgi:hypothetical protein